MNNKLTTLALICLLAATSLVVGAPRANEREEAIEQGFRTPPQQAQPWVYWWWLNGCVTKDGIVRDLDTMQRQGIGGALVFHAGEGVTPFRLEFMSKEWCELFKYTVAEAAQRDIVIGLNLCAGWNAGGPWVEPEDAVQTLGFKIVKVQGGKAVSLSIPAPRPVEQDNLSARLRRDAGVTAGVPTATNRGYYRDIATVAWKSMTLAETATTVCRKDSFVDLTDRLRGDQLEWQAPVGDWVIVRFGHFVGPRAHTKCTGGGVYLEIDPLRPDTMDRHFAATAGILINEVKEHVGKTFQFVHIDSGEIGKPDWTPAFCEEFRKRRGYDPLPFLAARAGLLVENREITERFNEDYDRTLGDLMVENYYGRLHELARRNGLGTHSEAAGFQKPCVDALASLGCNDISMSEFWDRRGDAGDTYIHQLTESLARNHDGIKTAASAAHIYGRRIVQAEAFTVMRNKTTFPNWIRDPFSLKDLGDRAFCAGLNRLVFHQFVHQPEEESKPGYKWPGIGNEFDRHVTWSPFMGDWLTYLARCQHLLQSGEFVADVCYFPGEWVPNYLPARWAMNPRLPEGFDCDAVSAGLLADGAGVAADGRLTLPSGMAYRYLVLNQGGRWQNAKWMAQFLGQQPAQPAETNEPADARPQPLALSPPLLNRIKTLVESGITLVGPPPARAIGLSNYPASDREVARLASEIWGSRPSATGEHKLGKGRVIWGANLDEVVRADGLQPDLEIHEDAASRDLTNDTLNGVPNPYGSFDWIHRRIRGTDVYFIANLRNAGAGGEMTFRVQGQRPECWDPVTGERRDLPEFTATLDGRTRLPLHFEPRQSFFVVFRHAENQASGVNDLKSFRSLRNSPKLSTIGAIDGPWEVTFDPKWGGPRRAVFTRLEDWSKRPEQGIKYYSGTATYHKTFDLPASAIHHPQSAIYLDLGEVKNLARVRLNGRDLGVVWTAPWRMEITSVAKAGSNGLEVDVVNLWPNRLIGDAALPPEQRVTKTNVTGIRADWPLFASGLLGPVKIISVHEGS